MKTLETIGFSPALGQSGNPPAQDGLVISYEWVIVAGASAIFTGVIAAGKWLIGREFARFEQRDQDQQQKLEEFGQFISNQRLESQTLERLDNRVVSLERQVKSIELVLESVPRIEKQVQGLEELKTLGPRFDNVVFALNQAQEMIKDFQRDLMTLRAEMPKTYVPEEKYVRDMTVMTSRVDAVWARIDDAASGMRYLESGQ